jgi:uncharacterized SAM-binding protein YcdF (DUF218 family)
VYSLIKALALPPALFFVLLLAGWLVSLRWPRIGRVALLSLFCLVYLSTTPFLAGELMARLQPYAPLKLDEPQPDVGAIVVLGAGIYFSAPEYWRPGAPPFGVDVADGLGLQRLAYAAYLAKSTGKPILLSGGASDPRTHRSVADAMRTTLIENFSITPRWAETRSSTTMSNAQYSADILKREGIHRAYLVTHAWHMPRAVLAFEHAGLEVVPAPTGFVSRSGWLWGDFLPSAQAFQLTYYGLHEWAGMLWYRLQIGD